VCENVSWYRRGFFLCDDLGHVASEHKHLGSLRVPWPCGGRRRDHQHVARDAHGLPQQPRPRLAPSPVQLLPPTQLAWIPRTISIDFASCNLAPGQDASISAGRPRLPRAFASQPLENTIGSIALYLLTVVVVTSYFRTRLGRRAWKAFHFSIYVAAVAFFIHNLLTDPDLKKRTR
jgi:hypothetical protein